MYVLDVLYTHRFTIVHFVGVTRVVMFYVSFQASTAGGAQMIVLWVVVVCRIILLCSCLAEKCSETSGQI